ncbi:hypothetical protein [Streptomyces sp. YIM 132580]|uniref:hypothetical protein n=1 Tax=Streptomyces sp. YIM 132580 TaxID=2691958 RepID=UPI00136F1CDC|nr:hypothetical protein [Streptomyces sp. YIM 132580]MXG30459.1 hypothetical protein [Streptomyces sp. YIM 132580]
MDRYEITHTATRLVPPGIYHCVARVYDRSGTVTLQGPIRVTETSHPQTLADTVLAWVRTKPGMAHVGLVDAVLST